MEVQNIFTEIRDFFLNKTVLDYAVASVFSRTFYPMVMSLVKGIIIPISSALFYKINVKELSFNILGVIIAYGELLTNITVFVISMLVVFFIFIKPFSNVIDKEKMKKEKQEKQNKQKIADAVNSINNIEKLVKERRLAFGS